MTPQKTDPRRSAIMRSVKSKDTGPEMHVRRVLHGLGFRYRLHRKDLAGVPDIVFLRLHKVVLVHGCFWHGHTCQRGSRIPKTNRDYWAGKINRNRKRDELNSKRLEAQGWLTFVIWECQTHDDEVLEELRAFLSDGK